jgi:hypothetical protein
MSTRALETRFFKRRSSLTALALIGVLVACTGSFEGNPNLSLIVPVRGTAAYTIFCNGTSQTFTAPGLLQLGVDTLQDTGSGSGTCAQTAAPAQPYDIVGTAVGDNIFISYPTLGSVQRLTSSLAPVTGFTLQGAPADFCPTRLSLSPDETRLVALDDPADPNSGCPTTTPRPARVAVFDARSGGLQTGGLIEVASADLRQSGQIAAALDNASLVILEPFAGSYRLERYALGALSNPPARSDILGGFAAPDAAVDVGLTPQGFQVAIGSGSSAQTVGVTLQTGTTPATIAFGAPVTAVLQANQNLPIGAANRIVGNRVPDNSLTAYLTNSGLILKRDSRPSAPATVDSARVGITAVDIAFPPDGFAYALGGFAGSGSSLVKIDPVNLSSVGVVSSTGLNGATAFALAWVIQP